MIKQIPVNWQWTEQLCLRSISEKAPAAYVFLRDELQLKANDTLAICLTNSEDLFALIQAAFRLGICLFFYNPRLKAETLNAQLRLAPCTRCLSDKTLDWQGSTTPLPRFKNNRTCDIFKSDLPTLESIACAIPSSGSTGTSKHILLSRRALLESAWRCNQHLGIHQNDHWLLCLPLFHVGGLSIVFRSACNAAAVTIQNTFDKEHISTLLDKNNVSCVSLVPTMLKRLLSYRDQKSWSSSLRCIIIGGARSNKNDLDHSAQLGCRPVCSYGLSEFASQVATQRVPATHNKNCGAPIDGVEIRIDQGQRIALRGPTAFSGYFIDGAHTEAHDQNTWFETHDRGKIDENGDLHILGRSDDVIIRGGENISLTYIEHAIEQLGLCDVLCVVAQDHPDWGQVPVLFFQSDLTAAELGQQINEHIDSVLQPHSCKRLGELPLLANGKIDRQALAQLLEND